MDAFSYISVDLLNAAEVIVAEQHFTQALHQVNELETVCLGFVDSALVIVCLFLLFYGHLVKMVCDITHNLLCVLKVVHFGIYLDAIFLVVSNIFIAIIQLQRSVVALLAPGVLGLCHTRQQ